jgi:hypothetical protein
LFGIDFEERFWGGELFFLLVYFNVVCLFEVFRYNISVFYVKPVVGSVRMDAGIVADGGGA